MKNKVHSVLIPFLVWNTYAMLFFMIVTRLPVLSSMINEGKVVPITARNIFEGVFLHRYYIVFWFMQDLIVLTALSPVLKRLLRKRYLTYASIIALTALFVKEINFPFCQTRSVLFFLIGGALSVYHREYWEIFDGNYFKTAVYIALFTVCAAIRWASLPVLASVSLVLSPILIWKSFDLLTLFNVFEYEPQWFIKQSFFIYAAHDFAVETLSTVLLRISDNMVWVSLCYILNPLTVLVFLYVAATFMNKNTPKLYRIISGNRG